MRYDYIVKKFNVDGCNYDNLIYTTSKEARQNYNPRKDILIKCRNAYYGDNWQGWTCKEKDIIKVYDNR